MSQNKKKSKGLILIILISIVVPLAVLFLLYFPSKFEVGSWVKNLPHVIAGINTSTSLILIGALYAIRKRMIGVHKSLMTVAVILGALFLITYVVYHASVPSTVFGDVNHDGVLSVEEKDEVGGIRVLYLILLSTHILCSFFVLPLVLLSYYYGISDLIANHKKLVRWSYPIWLFVSVSGVFIYLMISPFYS